MTYDRGSEMARHKELSANTGIAVCFRDRHSPWQRVSNENRTPTAWRASIYAKAQSFQAWGVKAFDEPNLWDARTTGLNVTSAGAFFVALTLTIAFIINLEGNRMATGNYKPASTVTLEKKGAAVPTMQRPASAPVPTPPASAPANAQRNGAGK